MKGTSYSKIEGVMMGIILGLLTVVIVVSLIAGFAPTVITSLTCLSGVSGLSFASFYAAGGIAQLVFGAAVLILVVVLFMRLFKTSTK